MSNADRFREFTPEEKKELVARFADGVSLQRLAEHAHTHKLTVKRALDDPQVAALIRQRLYQLANEKVLPVASAALDRLWSLVGPDGITGGKPSYNAIPAARLRELKTLAGLCGLLTQHTNAMVKGDDAGTERPMIPIKAENVQILVQGIRERVGSMQDSPAQLPPGTQIEVAEDLEVMVQEQARKDDQE